MLEILIVEDLVETQKWLENIAREAFGPALNVHMAATIGKGLVAAKQTRFHVALVDLNLPDGSGLEILKALRKTPQPPLCVVTTVIGDDAHIVAALSAGADGYILKEQPPEVIIQQLSQLANGVPALSPAIARRIMEHFRLTGPAAEPQTQLTPREKDVLAHIGCGMRNIEVAADLNISENTVAQHIKSIYRKLGISSRAEASWHARRMGLLPHGSS